MKQSYRYPDSCVGCKPDKNRGEFDLGPLYFSSQEILVV